MKYKKEMIGCSIWSGILFFRWYCLYGIITEQVLSKESLFSYTCSVTGLQAPFLHGTLYLLIYLMFLDQFIKEWRIEFLIRQSRLNYMKQNFKTIWIKTGLFIITYGTTYSLCISSICSFNLLLSSGFYSTLLFYMTALWVFYTFMGQLFILFSLLVSHKPRAYAFTILIASGLLAVRYFLRLPTPYSCLDVFDMVYYRGKIPFSIFLSRTSGVLLCTLAIEKLSKKIFFIKDVWNNEIL